MGRSIHCGRHRTGFHTSKVRLKQENKARVFVKKSGFHTSKVRLKRAIERDRSLREYCFHTSKVRLKQDEMGRILKTLRVSIPLRFD